MSATLRPYRLRQALALAFVTLILMVSAMVPRGYMLEPSAEHGFAVTLCPDTHPLAQALSQQAASPEQTHAGHGGHHGNHEGDHHSAGPDEGSDTGTQSSSDCAFAGLTGAGLPGGDAGWDDIDRSTEAVAFLWYRTASVVLNHRWRPPLRGPPQQA